MTHVSFASLRSRLLLLVLIPVLALPAVMASGVREQQQRATVEAVRKSQRLARSAASDQERLIQGTRHVLHLKVRRPQIAVFTPVIAIPARTFQDGCCHRVALLQDDERPDVADLP